MKPAILVIVSSLAAAATPSIAKDDPLFEHSWNARTCVLENAGVLAKRSSLKTSVIMRASVEACDDKIVILAKFVWDQAIGDSAAPMPKSFKEALAWGYFRSIGFVVDEIRANQRRKRKGGLKQN